MTDAEFMDLIQSKSMSVEELCRVFALPPHLLGPDPAKMSRKEFNRYYVGEFPASIHGEQDTGLPVVATGGEG